MNQRTIHESVICHVPADATDKTLVLLLIGHAGSCKNQEQRTEQLNSWGCTCWQLHEPYEGIMLPGGSFRERDLLFGVHTCIAGMLFWSAAVLLLPVLGYPGVKLGMHMVETLLVRVTAPAYCAVSLLPVLSCPAAMLNRCLAS
jgi:hypothetical protein